MSVVTDHYHALTCNGRVDNIVTNNVCTTRSAGRWHDAEAMEQAALAAGWTRAGRGHNCPSCSAAAPAEASTTVAAPKQRGGRSKSPATDQPAEAQSDDWSGQ